MLGRDTWYEYAEARYLSPWRRLGGERRDEDTNGKGDDEPDDLEPHGVLLLWETQVYV